MAFERDRGPRKMWPAKCSEPGCTNEFEVPFEPKADRPVYCPEHFKPKRRF